MDNYEREFKLKEIFWYIIGKWKWLVAGLLIGAVLLGGYTAYKNNKSNQPVSEEELTEDQLKAVDKAIELYKTHINMANRAKDNYILDFNTENVYVEVLQYYINSDYKMDYTGEIGVDYTASIAEAYRSYIGSNEFKNIITGYKMKGIDFRNIGYVIYAGINSRLLTVTVKGVNKADADKLAEATDKAINEYTASIKNIIGEHSITLMTKSETEMYDDSLLGTQNSIKNAEENALNNLEKAIKAFNNKQTKVYEEKIAELEDKEYVEEQEEITKKPLIDKKKIIVGAAGGFIFAAAIIFVIYVSGSRLRNREDIKNIFKDGFVKYVVTSDNKLKYSKRLRISSTSGQYEYTGRLIEDACRQKGITEVIAVSSIGMTDETKNIVDKISECIHDIKVVCNTEPIEYCVDTMKNISDCKYVILVETIDKSSVDSLGNIKNLMDNYGVSVLGSVITV